MINDPYRDPWRRLFNRGTVPEEPVAPPAAPTTPWDRLMRQPAPGPVAAPLGGVAPQQMPTYDERLTAQAAPAVVRQPTQSPRVARFQALVEQGVIDPRNILGPDDRVRPDILALLDQQPGYRGVVAPGYGGEPGTEFINPAEQQAAQWERTFLGNRENLNVARSGQYWDPATQSYRVTADYGGALLDRFGTARRAEEQYRQQVQQAQGATIGPQAQLDAAERGVQAAAMEQIPGRANVVDEARLAAANRARDQALMAYNRARGVGRPLQGQAPISVAQLGAGMTPEQMTAAGLAVAQGYSPEELEALRQNPQAFRGARYQPAHDYYRAASARGVI